jgi:hypothetical protein
METLTANLCVAWLCLGQPIVFCALGVYLGQHGGVRHGLTLILQRIFGHAPEVDRAA